MGDNQSPAPRFSNQWWTKQAGTAVGLLFGGGFALMLHADCNIFVLNVRALLEWGFTFGLASFLLLAPNTIKKFLCYAEKWETYPSFTGKVVKVHDPMARLPREAQGFYLYRKFVWIVEEDVTVDLDNYENLDPLAPPPPGLSIVPVRKEDNFVVGDSIALVRYTNSSQLEEERPVYVPFQRYLAFFALRFVGLSLVGILVMAMMLWFLYPGAPILFASREQIATSSDEYFCWNEDNDEDDASDCCVISQLAWWGYLLWVSFPVALLIGFTVRRKLLARNTPTTSTTATTATPLVQAEHELA
jgi:hypothetical protein